MFASPHRGTVLHPIRGDATRIGALHIRPRYNGTWDGSVISSDRSKQHRLEGIAQRRHVRGSASCCYVSILLLGVYRIRPYDFLRVCRMQMIVVGSTMLLLPKITHISMCTSAQPRCAGVKKPCTQSPYSKQCHLWPCKMKRLAFFFSFLYRELSARYEPQSI